MRIFYMIMPIATDVKTRHSRDNKFSVVSVYGFLKKIKNKIKFIKGREKIQSEELLRNKIVFFFYLLSTDIFKIYKINLIFT